MSEIRTVTTLRRKRDQISAAIRLYERQLGQARADLASVTAAIRIFEASGDPEDIARYVDSYRLFKRGEPWAICSEAMRKEPRTTIELATALVKAKGMDARDKTLVKGLTNRLIHSLRMQEQRGRVVRDGKRKGVIVWRLPPNATLL
jgi:hypothetical protein